MPFTATWMGMGLVMSQMEKDKYAASLICKPKNYANLFTKQKQTQIHRKQAWLPKGKVESGGRWRKINQEFRYTHQYI